MRKIAEIIDKNMADKIGQEMNKQGVFTEVRGPTEKGIYEFYVREEDVEKAVELFGILTGLGGPRREMPKEWRAINALKMGPVTLTILVFCVSVFASYKLMGSETLYRMFLISNFKKPEILPEVVAGEYWRLVTPSFLHFGWLHIIFNMLWWRSLATVMEKTKGAHVLILFVIICSIISNFLQYVTVGPLFGGLSGVVYGLLGYLFAIRTICPDYEYGLPKEDAVLMIGWFFLGVFQIIGHMANMGHALGLSVGILWAFGTVEVRMALSGKLKKALMLVSFALIVPIFTFFMDTMFQ